MDYEAQFNQMFAELKTDPSALQTFLSNPQPMLQARGIPVLALAGGGGTSQESGMAGVTTAAATLGNYQLDVEKHWWGVDFVMNEDLTQAIANGSIVGPPLVALITSSLAAAGFVTGPVAAVIAAAFGTAIATKIAEIKLVDKGKGVHWPITWIQWAAVVAAVPGGPATILTAMLVWIHPLPN